MSKLDKIGLGAALIAVVAMLHYFYYRNETRVECESNYVKMYVSKIYNAEHKANLDISKCVDHIDIAFRKKVEDMYSPIL